MNEEECISCGRSLKDADEGWSCCFCHKLDIGVTSDRWPFQFHLRCLEKWKKRFPKAKCRACSRYFYTNNFYISNTALLKDTVLKKCDLFDLLKYAVVNEDLGLIEMLYSLGENINAENNFALTASAELGRLNLVKFLVEHGAYVHAKNSIALLSSASNDHFEVFKYLIEQAGADSRVKYEKALALSAISGHLEIVKYLVERGANVQSENRSALVISSRLGHFEIVKYLIENGADFRVDHYLPFIHSVISGHLDVMKYLVNLGADPHIGFNYVNIKTKFEFPLIYSSSTGSIEIVKYLVEECGADMHAEGDMALREASKNDRQEVLNYLKNYLTRI